MSIEFRCTGCDKLLATPPGTQGQQAKCPECGTVLIIPEPSAVVREDVDPQDAPPPREPDFASSAETPPRDPGFDTADQPSARPGEPSAAQPPAPATFVPTRIAFGEVLGTTWRIYASNLGVLTIGGLLYLICVNAAKGAVLGISVALAEGAEELIAPMVLLQVIANPLITSFFLIGLMKFMLTVARGERIDFGDLFSAGALTLPAVGTLVLFLLGTVFGLAFCLIPGVIFLLVFSQSLFMLLDQRTNIIDSFRCSAAAMKGNLLTLFLLALTVGFVALLVIVMTCGVGLLFAVPFVNLMLAVLYLGVTGQRTANECVGRFDAERPFDTPGVQPT